MRSRNETTFHVRKNTRLSTPRGGRTLHAPIHKGSNLGTGLRKLAGSSVTTPSPNPTKTQQDSRKHQFSVLNWLRNVIKCASNYIPEPIKHTKTSVFCCAVKFCSGIWLGSPYVCHDKTTSKLSLTSSEV